MSQIALKSFISMNLVPNMGRKGGFFKKSNSNLPKAESPMQSRTQIGFGLQSTNSYADNNRNSKLGYTTTNLTQLLKSEHERELMNSTVPPRLHNSRVTESRKQMHTISHMNASDKGARAFNSVQVRYLNDESQLLKGTLKTSMPRLRNETFSITSDQRAPTVDNEKTVSRNRIDTQE